MSHTHPHHFASSGTPDTCTISGAMSCGEVIAHLRHHGCEEITNQLNLAESGIYPIANGGFGDVFRGVLQNGNLVAIKCLRIMVGVDDDEGRKQLRRAAHEIYVWSKCKHPNVLELTGIAQYQNRIAMVSPWMEQGNLTWFLSRNPTIDKYAMVRRAQEVHTYIYTNTHIIHGDIKALNILISSNHTPKLADFGTSVLNNYTLNFTRGSKSGLHSTIRYTAPEILTEQTKLTKKGDVYALGMEALTGAVPYAGLLEPVVLMKILTRIHPTRPEKNMPQDKKQADILWEILTCCWEFEPQNRPDPNYIADTLRTMITPIPRVKCITPQCGPIYGGIEVTLLGDNLLCAHECIFGDNTTKAEQQGERLVCVLPPAVKAGTVPVRIGGSENIPLRPWENEVVFTYEDEQFFEAHETDEDNDFPPQTEEEAMSPEPSLTSDEDLEEATNTEGSAEQAVEGPSYTQSSVTTKTERSFPNRDKLRIWHDRTGQFKVEAEFLGVRGGKVKLHKANGIIIDVPLEKMSFEDRTLIDRLSSTENFSKRLGPSSPQTGAGRIRSHST
ncbi:kinase-like domain-containing protein [Rhizoctonia solani]|nr:kinase-like domain-containing protein [Rhizoctonia solani]